MKSAPTLIGSSKVTSKAQITIPQDVRKKYGIEKGDTVYFIEEGEKLVLKKGPITI
jgi:AbrB family looped-hinge helix DNA binding protein